MFKIPHLEINCIPSALNTSAPTGVASQLAAISDPNANFDGITIDQMRGNPLYDRCDDIDKVGVAQKKVIENAKVVRSKRGMIRQFNEVSQKISKAQAQSN